MFSFCMNAFRYEVIIITTDDFTDLGVKNFGTICEFF